ncbi:MAG: malonyl-CoA decarboxylase [Rhodovibrionaceae bacterium]
MTLLTQLMTSVADAGLELLRPSERKARRSSVAALQDLCRDLMSSRGEALGTALARDAVAGYRHLDTEGKTAFLKLLAEKFAPDAKHIADSVKDYVTRRDAESYRALTQAVEAPRQELFRRLNLAPNGTAALVELRQDILERIKQHPELKEVDVDLGHLLSSWFNRGFLYFRRIDWHTPADILEKLIRYEAVHQMNGWDDLRRRLAADRRCFAFFHPALPDEPLIFIEVALVKGTAGAIGPILDKDGLEAPLEEADTAVFYSISNCQPGLRGISFGNFLIKQVVLELTGELPSLKTFVTLSPVPGFRRWLSEVLAAPEGVLSEADCKALAPLLRDGAGSGVKALQKREEALLRACARYLLESGKGPRRGDPVARFHLGNGAVLHRINWMGDGSEKGLAQSFGLLVNYLYDLSAIERNHEDFVNKGKVAASSSVTRLAR